MYPRLHPGYTIRHPTENDIPAIITVMREFDIAETGESDAYSQEDILTDWENLDRTRDLWVVIAPDGLLCGYATLTLAQKNERIFADGYVHPAHYGHGVGTTLVELMEARAKEIVATQPEELQLALVNNIIASSPNSRALLETRGYTLTRVYFRMSITLDTTPQQPAWPQGIVVRTCEGTQEDLYRAYQTIEEGFQDHWAHTLRSFGEWQRHMLREQFDLTLWFLAYSDNEIVGAILCLVREDGQGWVEQLTVLRPWRKHGLGTALLYHAFSTFQQRNILNVGLAVDGQSLTGAQRLYERAGMHITMRIGRYEKALHK
ncbi:MAG TPA: GNAT family N-acetyltransferase [Ktedonobacteraceae bacterium]